MKLAFNNAAQPIAPTRRARQFRRHATGAELARTNDAVHVRVEQREAR
jgi:hypothetical protein